MQNTTARRIVIASECVIVDETIDDLGLMVCTFDCTMQSFAIGFDSHAPSALFIINDMDLLLAKRCMRTLLYKIWFMVHIYFALSVRIGRF